ncbi:DUF4112 domain-containing protein [Parvularcula maris]|uniref:DUF4112 domain-containing protein n=1 Tax=Parvularcula maris TaxID=2965077 RepID=A0A9X2L6E7_9PROT|nr:DUF4112 domain-containing protein [Parvularcula maris]
MLKGKVKTGPDRGRRGRNPAEPEVLPPEVARLDRLADLMDSRFSFLGIRFGLDSILGLIPGVGDAAALGMSGYLIAEAARAGASKGTLVKMAMNSGVDAVIGSVPLIGDAFDVVFKANRRNVALVRREMLRRHEERLDGEVSIG